MARFRRFALTLRYIPLVLLVPVANSQSCLILSAPTFSANGTASLELSLISFHGEGPAAVQWSFQFPPTVVQNLIVDDGSALTSARKTAMCYGNADGYTCLVFGANANPIGNGVIAKLTAVLVPGASAAPISIRSSVAVSGAGYFVPLESSVLPSHGAYASSDCAMRPPQRRGSPSK